MIVIERDGKTIVITGWRAWVIGAAAVVVMTAALDAPHYPVTDRSCSARLENPRHQRHDDDRWHDDQQEGAHGLSISVCSLRYQLTRFA